MEKLVVKKQKLSFLSPQITLIVREIKDTFTKAGYELYLVGGFVRNSLLGSADGDMDFTTNALPEQIDDLFKKTSSKIVTIPTGIKHGTITLVVEKHHFEITTYRSDGEYLDARHPKKVTYLNTLEEDLKRRDFTINALAYDLDKHKILDYHGGLADLKAKVIRCVGVPKKRFEEDALRMMRACRFASQLGFTISPDTQLALASCSENINLVSKERIKDELVKMLSKSLASAVNAPAEGFEQLRQAGLLPLILPELANTIDVQQNHFHRHDVYRHTLMALNAVKLYPPKASQTPPSSNNNSVTTNYRVALATLLHDLAKPLTQGIHPDTGEPTFYKHEIAGAKLAKSILKRLCFSKKDTEYIAHLVKHHMLHYQSEWKDASVRRFIKRIGFEHIEDLFQLVRADRVGKDWDDVTTLPKVNEELFADLDALSERIKVINGEDACLSVKELDINGQDLMKLGISPGPMMGKVLDYLLNQVIEEPELNEKQGLIRLAEKYVKGLL